MRDVAFIVGIVLIVTSAIALVSESKEGDLGMAIRATSDVCEASDARYECYDKEVATLSKIYSTDAILNTLETGSSQGLVKDCHVFTHAVGHQVYKEAESFVSAFSGCTDYCFSGCYHGIAEEHFSQQFKKGIPVSKESFSEITSFFETCSSNEAGERCWKEFGDALHGVGHALMFIEGNDVATSLIQCDAVSPSNTARACYDGVFMSNNENFFELGVDTLFAKQDDPLFPCDSLDSAYQSTCYKSVAEYRLSGTAEENIRLCQKFPESEQQYCFEQVARAQTVNIKDITELSRICLGLDAEYQVFCIKGTERYLIDKYDKEEGRAFCSSLPAELRASCSM